MVVMHNVIEQYLPYACFSTRWSNKHHNTIRLRENGMENGYHEIQVNGEFKHLLSSIRVAVLSVIGMSPIAIELTETQCSKDDQLFHT